MTVQMQVTFTGKDQADLIEQVRGWLAGFEPKEPGAHPERCEFLEREFVTDCEDFARALELCIDRGRVSANELAQGLHITVLRALRILQAIEDGSKFDAFDMASWLDHLRKE